MAFYPGEMQQYILPEEAFEEIPVFCIKIEYEKEKVRASRLGAGEEPVDVEEESGQVEISYQGKSMVKRCLYHLLSRQTGKVLPWGTLTGIRPTKIATAMLEEGMLPRDIAQRMELEHLVSPGKAALSVEIAAREQALLSDIPFEKGYSLYIGIPFCPSTCFYCSFTSYPLSRFGQWREPYLEALYKELSFAAERFRGKQLHSVYIGGGTPTTLEPEQLDRLIGQIQENFDLQYLREFTVEAGRPDSITPQKLDAIRHRGVDRISINPQTMKEETLRLIGRHHTVEQVRQIFRMAREMGFSNINMDLILGLPYETAADVAHTVEEIEKLAPDNLTVHSLAVKKKAKLHLEREQYEKMPMDNSELLMEMTAEGARKMGLFPYYLYRQKNMAGNLENVGYAAPGKGGYYNMLIMEEKESIVALGAGASTKVVHHAQNRIERCENVKDLGEYTGRIEEMIERKRRLFADWQ